MGPSETEATEAGRQLRVYISEITGEINSLAEGTARLSDHYQARKDECCPLRNTDTDQTTRGAASELEELIEQMLLATTVGMADSRDDVMDEAGDTFYGAFCYTVAWKEHTSRAVSEWRTNAQEKETQTLTEQDAQSTQTLADHTSWRTDSPAIEQRMNEISCTMVEKMNSNTANGINCEVTMAGVRETIMEEISVLLDMKAGHNVIMTLATEIFTALNRIGMQPRHTATVITEATARKQRIRNSTSMKITSLIEKATQKNQSWEAARDECKQAMQLCITHGCPAWQAEQHKTSRLVTDAACMLTQQIQGQSITTDLGQHHVCSMERITEAAARLACAMSAAQHCVVKTASQEDDDEPTATHATAAANQGNEWHECQDITEEESEWHECEQQRWGRAKSAAIASNPGKPTSQIRREHRHRALQTAIAKKHKQEQAAMAQSDTAHSEEESESETRG